MSPERIEELAYACGPEPRYVNAVRWAVQIAVREALEEAAAACQQAPNREHTEDGCYDCGVDAGLEYGAGIVRDLIPADAPPHP